MPMSGSGKEMEEFLRFIKEKDLGYGLYADVMGRADRGPRLVIGGEPRIYLYLHPDKVARVLAKADELGIGWRWGDFLLRRSELRRIQLNFDKFYYMRQPVIAEPRSKLISLTEWIAEARAGRVYSELSEKRAFWGRRFSLPRLTCQV